MTPDSISKLSQGQKDILWFYAVVNDADEIVLQLLKEKHPDSTYYINLPAVITFSHGTEFSQVTALSEAALANAMRSAKILLEHGADPNTCDSTYRTPLHYAVIQGLAGMAELLLTNSANPNALSSDGFTPLHYATGVNSPEVAEQIIRKLIEKGAKRDMVSDRWLTPAAITSNANLKALLTATTYRTPFNTLEEALEAGDFLAAEPLMPKGIPLNFNNFTPTAKKTYLLTLARLFAQRESRRFHLMRNPTHFLNIILPDVYTDVSFQGYPDRKLLQNNFQIFDLFTDQDIDLIQSLPSKIQYALLVLGVEVQHEQFVCLLLKAGISPNITTYPTSILHTIVSEAASTGKFGILQALFESGYDINKPARHYSVWKKTIHATAIENLMDGSIWQKAYQLETITLLLQNGARYKLASIPNMHNIKLDIISTLLEHGKYEPDDLKEFIFQAVTHLRDDILAVLASRGIDLNVSKDGKSPIDCIPHYLFPSSLIRIRSRENILQILQENMPEMQEVLTMRETTQMRDIAQRQGTELQEIGSRQPTTQVQDPADIQIPEMQDRLPTAVRHLMHFPYLALQIDAPNAKAVSSRANPAAPVAQQVTVPAQKQTLGRTAPTPVSVAPATATRAAAKPPKTTSMASLTTAALNAWQSVSSSTATSDKRRDNGHETRPLLSRDADQEMVDFAGSDSETEEAAPVVMSKKRTAVMQPGS